MEKMKSTFMAFGEMNNNSEMEHNEVSRNEVERSEQERYGQNYDDEEEIECEDYDDEDYDYDDTPDEPGWGCYDEYGGYNGYDDFTIDSAFDGDPEATWNID